jgi:hypothetical protein
MVEEFHEEYNLRMKKSSSYKRYWPISRYERNLELAAIMLYWAEGCKSDKNTRVDFANSNPEMIRVFINFLRTSFSIDESKLRIYLYCYANQDAHELIEYWSNICSVPVNQFTKPYIRNDFNPLQKRIMEHGLIHIRYSDKSLLSEVKN